MSERVVDYGFEALEAATVAMVAQLQSAAESQGGSVEEYDWERLAAHDRERFRAMARAVLLAAWPDLRVQVSVCARMDLDDQLAEFRSAMSSTNPMGEAWLVAELHRWFTALGSEWTLWPADKEAPRDA